MDLQCRRHCGIRILGYILWKSLINFLKTIIFRFSTIGLTTVRLVHDQSFRKLSVTYEGDSIIFFFFFAFKMGGLGPLSQLQIVSVHLSHSSVVLHFLFLTVLLYR